MQQQFTRRGSATSWWFGAPLFGVLFGFAANRFFPDFVRSAAVAIYRISGNSADPVPIGPDATRFLAPLIGMILAVVLLGAWRLIRLFSPRHA
jgi:hypothetical protein